jgi:hypothetical protein
MQRVTLRSAVARPNEGVGRAQRLRVDPFLQRPGRPKRNGYRDSELKERSFSGPRLSIGRGTWPGSAQSLPLEGRTEAPPAHQVEPRAQGAFQRPLLLLDYMRERNRDP